MENAMNVKGSLQAAQAIASAIKTLLGPTQSTKCCVNGDDDRDVIICSNAAKILQYLEVEHPAGYIINDACQAMNKTDGCGCKTLVCMIGFWSRSALTLQHEGVPVSIITKLFDEALFNCLQVLEEIALPIQVCERSKYSDIPSSIQNTSQEFSSSTGSKPSRFIIEKVWITTEDGFNDEDIVYPSDNGSLSLSLSLDSNENKRKTQNVDANLPKTNKTHDKRILVADFQCCSGIKGNPSEESLLLDDTIEDEFDSCFDDLPVNVGTSHKTIIIVQKESERVHRSASSSKRMAHTNNTKEITNLSTNKSELEKMDQLLKDLNLNSGQKVISTKVSTGKNVSEILKSCRNLSIDSPKTQREQESHQAQEDCKESFNLDFIGKEDLERLANMLSHGKDKVMALAVEVIFHQISSSRKKMNLNKFYIDENAMNIETIIGPKCGHSQVVSGILLRQKSHRIGDFPLGALRVALVNGDITEEFRHAGFKDSFQTKRVFNEDSYKNLSTRNTSWLQKMLNVLRTLKIGVVIARGNIDKDLEDSCQAVKIQTFSCISPKTLQLLSHSLSSTAVVYLSDLKKSHVGKPIFLYHWNGPQPQMTNDNGVFVVLELAENNRAGLKENQGPLKTVLLCGPSEHLVVDLELAFWNCVFSLRNSINCGCILPGAGRAEMACVRKLRKISENFDHLQNKPSNSSSWLQVSLSSYRPAVYTAFADGLVEFLINLLSNSGCMMNYGQAHTVIQEAFDDHDQQLSEQCPLVADDFIAKKNAWSKAIGVVCLMLQSDMAIITGCQASTN